MLYSAEMFTDDFYFIFLEIIAFKSALPWQKPVYDPTFKSLNVSFFAKTTTTKNKDKIKELIYTRF